MQPFLVNFGRIRRDAAGVFAAYFGPVSNRDGKGDDAVINKNRLNQGDIAGMGAAIVRAVGHKDVAGLDSIRPKFLSNRLNLGGKRTGKEG